jgi:hypothetical protein
MDEEHLRPGRAESVEENPGADLGHLSPAPNESIPGPRRRDGPESGTGRIGDGAEML